MSQTHFQDILERLNGHRAAFARLALCTLAEAATTAVTLIGAVLAYETVVLAQSDIDGRLALFASTGLTAAQQMCWQQVERRLASFWLSLDLPLALDSASRDVAETQLLAQLGLHGTLLIVPLVTPSRDSARPDGLLIAARPQTDCDPAVDLGVLDLLALQLGASFASSRLGFDNGRSLIVRHGSSTLNSALPCDQATLLQAERQRFFECLAMDGSLAEVLAPLVRMLQISYSDGCGSLMICDETGLLQPQRVGGVQPGTYIYTSATGLRGPIEGLCPLGLHVDTSLIVADLDAEPFWHIYQQAVQLDGWRACWAQPFHDPEGTLLGMLVIAYHQPRPVQADSLQPLADVAQLAATGITRMRDEAMLRDREELFRLISENTTDHIGVLDATGNYLYASPSLHTSLGYNPEDLVGLSAFTHVHPDDLDITIASWSKVGENGLVQSTFRYRTTDGDWRWFDANGNAVSYRGERAFISVSRDVTERRQAEQARQRLEAQLAQAQKLESIGTLAGGIAHDFNNILTAILGNVQLALLGLQRQSPEFPLLQEIEKAATRASTLTRQLLTFSRYQQHERKAVDLNTTINDLLRMFRRLIGSTIEIMIDLAPDLPLLVADPVQIEQVVLNLAVNARDAMPDGGQLRISTRTTVLDETVCRDFPWTRPGPYVQISVRDTGTGMTVETQQRIFEPFFTTKEPGKGTGLGLAVVYGIIKQYDGFITVTSVIGQGSTFTVSLPAQTAVSLPSEPSEEPLARGGTETILVVEDEASLRQLATTILERLGYTVVCAENGLAAIDVFAADPQHFDLVILDLIMPRLGGREALARIRAIRPDVPAFFVTGYDSSAERTAAANTLSAAPILSKPYRLDTLGLTVRQLLDN